MTPAFVIEIAQGMAKKLGIQCSHAENIEWAEEYADNRETPKRGIFIGNWNNDQIRKGRQYIDAPGNIMRRLGEILERMGGELEWSDMVSTCSDCGRVIQTEPDSYDWQPEFELGDGEIVCTDCMDPEEYLSRLADEHGFNSIGSVDPSEHGYVRLNEHSFESGWHPGQTDDPRKVEKQLVGLGLKRFLFHKDEQSQFYATWSVYIPVPECENCGMLNVALKNGHCKGCTCLRCARSAADAGGSMNDMGWCDDCEALLSDDDDDAGRSCADPQPSDRDDV